MGDRVQIAMMVKNGESAKAILKARGWLKWLPWCIPSTLYLRQTVRQGEAMKIRWDETKAIEREDREKQKTLDQEYENSKITNKEMEQ
jgi:hypothetical protein